MKNKRGFLDISFSWIFAILVGAIILFGAIYFVHKVSSLKNLQNSAEGATSIENLLSPLETVLEASKSIMVTMPVNSRINHFCSTSGNFGSDSISILEYTNNKWSTSGATISSQSKYLFIPSGIQGKNFYVFSEPFSMPFPVANLMYFSSAQQTYCFVNAPPSVESNLNDLHQKNFEFSDSGNCSIGATKICFNSPNNCEANVNLDTNTNQGTVTKRGKTVYFSGEPLMYAAIFSDKTTYDCELNRLVKRTKELLSIYQQESNNLQTVGCNPSLGSYLPQFSGELSNFNSSKDIYGLSKTAGQMDEINQYSGCQLW